MEPLAKPVTKPVEPAATVRQRPTLREFFECSLKLGVAGFGGGMSVLAMIRNLAVERRRWMTDREFANTATVAQMLPGGASANTLAYMGLRFFGHLGAAVGYVGFLLPGMLLTLAAAFVYTRFGLAPRADALLSGFNAAVVGIIGSITLSMVRTSIGREWQMAVATGALLLSLEGGASSGEIALLGILVGLVVDLGFKRARLARFRKRHPSPPVALPETGQPLPRARLRRWFDEHTPRRHALPMVALAALGTHQSGLDTELLRIVLVFFRTGLGAYGGGFAIIPYLKQAVSENAWLTERQFSDAVAIGKLTPGPVLLMATFIGYTLRGVPGALLATVGIFAAPYVLVVALGTWLSRVRSKRSVRAALRGLTPAVVGLMGAAALTLGQSLHSGTGLAIAAGVALTMTRFQVNPVIMLVLGGGVRLALKVVAGM